MNKRVRSEVQQLLVPAALGHDGQADQGAFDGANRDRQSRKAAEAGDADQSHGAIVDCHRVRRRAAHGSDARRGRQTEQISRLLRRASSSAVRISVLISVEI